jgi:glutamine synthetase type III
MSLQSITKMFSQTARTQSAGASRTMSTMLSSINDRRFDDHALKAAVSADVYDAFHASIKSGEPCDKATSKAVSKAMMEWAQERGATMKAHWFR